MTKTCFCLAFIVVVLFLASPAKAQVKRIWLTHRSNDPSKLVVNWTTKKPGESQVRFVELKSLEGKVLDRTEISMRKDRK